jgi:hypothetical protein
LFVGDEKVVCVFGVYPSEFLLVGHQQEGVGDPFYVVKFLNAFGWLFAFKMCL